MPLEYLWHLKVKSYKTKEKKLDVTAKFLAPVPNSYNIPAKPIPALRE